MAAAGGSSCVRGVLLFFLFVPVHSPYGLVRSGTHSSSSSNAAAAQGGHAAGVAVAAVVATAALAAHSCRQPKLLAPIAPVPSNGSTNAKGASKRGRPVPLTFDACSDDGSMAGEATERVRSEDEEAGEESLFDGEEEDDVLDDDGVEAPAVDDRPPPPKLWTKKQFPEGVVPLAANWDMANLSAAQAWSCPCSDRVNCIGADRGISVLHLYEHRKKFLTTCKSTGGKRDTLKAQLSDHYASDDKTLARSFVVGPTSDCCAASFALANGVSCQTYENARADLRKGRTSKKVRSEKTKHKSSVARSTIDAYIRR